MQCHWNRRREHAILAVSHHKYHRECKWTQNDLFIANNVYQMSIPLFHNSVNAEFWIQTVTLRRHTTHRAQHKCWDGQRQWILMSVARVQLNGKKGENFVVNVNFVAFHFWVRESHAGNGYILTNKRPKLSKTKIVPNDALLVVIECVVWWACPRNPIFIYDIYFKKPLNHVRTHTNPIVNRWSVHGCLFFLHGRANDNCMGRNIISKWDNKQ